MARRKRGAEALPRPAQGEESTLTARVRRYARVGAAMGGLAVELAGKRYLGFSLDRGRHASDLALALGGLKGPLMKVAQLLSTIPDALPSEYASEHRAVAPDGRALAVKLQYPEMASVVAADLAQLKLVFALYERYDKAISTRNIHAELAERLREELDYEREARHMRLYGEMLGAERGVEVPDVLPELSTKRLLTMTWLEGAALVACKDWPLERRNKVANNMFRAWYVPFYFYGVIHGDPHLGNYTVTPDRTVNLLDFGCVRVFPANFVKGVIDLYHALERDDRDLAVHAYKSWGFANLSQEMIAVLNRWARFVYGPLLDDRTRPIQERRAEPEGPRLVDSVHGDIRRLGGIAPPRAFVFMDRAAVGLGSVFMHLKAEINWHRLFHELIDDFDEATLARRQRAALKRAGVPAEAG